MIYKLISNLLEVSIDHPLANYRNSRFDWTGKISEVKFRGMPLTTTEKPVGMQEHLFGKGLYNEFSMDTALGFEEADIGGWFHKIGVGLLQKDAPEYDFFKPYKVNPATFVVNKLGEKLIIECISEEINGYAYHLKKVITLNENQLSISYSLKNTGIKNINAEEYVHNFLAIKNEPVSPQYQLSFPFQIQEKNFGKTINPDELLQFKNNVVEFSRETENQFIVSFLNGEKTVNAKWELIHRSQNIGISETTSFPSSKINMWGWKHVISPEIFHHLSLKPGETEEWSRTNSVLNVIKKERKNFVYLKCIFELH
ncbi:MAG: hypothetical protein JJ895_16210, partial [Balneolaceae bacterium]|nr:hypothetical protein [Balneolaceae bacterium]